MRSSVLKLWMMSSKVASVRGPPSITASMAMSQFLALGFSTSLSEQPATIVPRSVAADIAIKPHTVFMKLFIDADS